MKRIVRLTESDLVKLVKRVIKEQQTNTQEPYPGTTTDPTTGQKIIPKTFGGTELYDTRGKRIPKRGPLLTQEEASALEPKGLVKLKYIYDDAADKEGKNIGLVFQVLQDFKINRGQGFETVFKNTFLNSCDSRLQQNCPKSTTFQVIFPDGKQESITPVTQVQEPYRKV
jgi:hypothetical protein